MMPPPGGWHDGASALPLAPIGSAVAGDVGKPPVAVERGVLRCAEVGECVDLGVGELQRRGNVSTSGEGLRVVSANGIRKSDEMLFGHFGWVLRLAGSEDVAGG